MTSATDDTAVGEDAPSRSDAAVQRLQTIGRYVVLDRLGAGGMGIVYAAYDPELDRKLALKLLHPIASARAQQPDHVRDKVMHRLFGDAIAEPTPDPADQTRLLREAQAAARISDPHVVTVHDVGQHEGRVFIAMEYVQGATLSAWLAASARSWREIVGVMIDAGRGLAAAHDKGVVHRDFKPDNVMIGDDGRVRVMDFGLAHGQAADPVTEETRPTNDTLAHVLTRDGAVMGTPGYMAPEQFLAHETDARTDQFSFCVTLWEALHGVRPFAADSIASLAIAVTEGRREPPPPESKVPAHVRRVLDRGLAVEPDARYPSMQALLAELRRDPTRARRGWLAGGALVAIAAAGVGAWQLDRIRTAERCDDEAHAIAEVWNDDARTGIETVIRDSGAALADATIERVHPWLDDYADRWTLMRADACMTAARATGHDAEISTQTIECLDERLTSLESTVRVLQQPSPHVVRRAVLIAARLPLLSSCADEAAIARRTPLPTDPELREQVLALRRRVAQAITLEASGEFAAALELVRDVAEQAEALEMPSLVTSARFRTGALHERMGDYDAAVKELGAAALQAAEIGDDEEAAEAAARLAVVVAERKADYELGLVWAHWAEAFVRRVGAEDELLASNVYNQIAMVHHGRGAAKEALAYHERALTIDRRILGPTHPDVAIGLNNVGTVHSTLGEFDAAENDYRAALVVFEAALGPDHPDTAMPLVNLAEMDWRRGRLDDARAHMERALAIQEAAFGASHPTVGNSVGNLGLLLAEQGDHAGALALHERALAIIEPTLGPEHPRIASALGNLGDAQRWLGQLDAARRNHERSLAMREKLLGPDHQEVAIALHALGTDLRVAGELDEARARQERAVAVLEKAFGPEHPDLGAVLTELGRTELELGRHAAATATLQRAVDLLDDHDASAKHRGHARLQLARAAWEIDRTRALAAARSARELLLTAGPASAKDLAEVERWLAEHEV